MLHFFLRDTQNVSNSMSIHSPGEQVIDHFICILMTHVIITGISASECVALLLYVTLHVCVCVCVIV